MAAIPKITEETSQGDAKVAELKRQIARNEYEVDAQRVAGAILGKLKLVRTGRLALANARVDRARMARPPRDRRHRRSRMSASGVEVGG